MFQQMQAMAQKQVIIDLNLQYVNVMHASRSKSSNQNKMRLELLPATAICPTLSLAVYMHVTQLYYIYVLIAF